MTGLAIDVARLATAMFWLGLIVALSTAAAVVVERSVLAYHEIRGRIIETRYAPLVRRALDGDRTAARALAASPRRHHLGIGWLMVPPLIANRDKRRIARTRRIFRLLSLPHLAERYLRSWLWWRRALALRALGLLQMTEYTARIVAALDDPNEDVRGAALDAIADLRDPRTLPAIIVRLHDASLQPGRRLAALAAFGPACEPMLLDLSRVDTEHRLNYARALAICGTDASRPDLCEWTADPRPDVRAAAFEALAHVGLDRGSARLAIAALDSGDMPVRAMAATALHGWGGRHAAARLARHLDDTWTVAIRAARSLQSMGAAGLSELRRWAAKPGAAGLLARQMVWEAGTR
jgi:HEAT repeat protein